ncbi:MAG TPA: type III pantothenate kinase [Bacteroidales bacterium]|nr:type III pantothenate kinase [Bacteroidales bacterium]HRT90384.1 type III pantothenate kinase [Bacteroidales bacterium]
MNLVIDIGNSGLKYAFFSGDNIFVSGRLEKYDKETFAGTINASQAGKAIISSVKDLPEEIVSYLSGAIPYVHLLTPASDIPFPVDYKTPETLGSDRIAGICGAYKRTGGLDCLVIDAGTAITFDFFTGGRYRGGNISPGIAMRFRALNQFSNSLPLIKPSGKFTFPGDTTVSAIEAGVLTGVRYEINEYIRTFKENHKESEVFLTGGDSGMLAEVLENRHIAVVPSLVLEGLNFILDYNAE